ncbi:MAG: hypothetical protein OHK0024_02720 [Thalassobaculales bacterium]
MLGISRNWGGGKRRPAERFRAMVDLMPINVMTCDPQDFRIDYANRSTIETLTRIEHVLPVKAKDLVGTSIDVFHKNPGHQRRLLSDPGNLPHQARISIGGEVLDLRVTAVFDAQGRYLQPMLTWKLVTAEVAREAEVNRLLQMLDNMPINVMLASAATMDIVYANRRSIETLRGLEAHVPIPADRRSAPTSMCSTRTPAISAACWPTRATCRTTPASPWGRSICASTSPRSTGPMAAISARW